MKHWASDHGNTGRDACATQPKTKPWNIPKSVNLAPFWIDPLTSYLASYVTGQTLEVNGAGEGKLVFRMKNAFLDSVLNVSNSIGYHFYLEAFQL